MVWDAITPVAIARVATNSAGNGVGLSWGAYDTTNDRNIHIQNQTLIIVITDMESFDDHNVQVFSKTTSGFTVTMYSDDGSAGTVIVYGSDPRSNVALAVNSLTVHSWCIYS